MSENEKNLADLIDYSDVAAQIVKEVDDEAINMLKREQFWEEKESGNVFSVSYGTDTEIVLISEQNNNYGEHLRVAKTDFIEKYKFLRDPIVKLENNFKVLIIALHEQTLRIKVSSIDAVIIDSKDVCIQPTYSIIFNGYKFTVTDDPFIELFNSEKAIFRRIASFDK